MDYGNARVPQTHNETTGFIGQEVLHQCLQNPSITSLVALSRRDLPGSATGNPKLKVLILNDFTSYPDTVLQELAGAESRIYYLPPFLYPPMAHISVDE